MSQTVKVYCLASFTDDEADEILTQLEDDSYDSYSSSNVRIDLIPWTQDQDGGKDDIFRLFFESQETVEDFMFFFDRTSLDRQDFLIADVRAAKKAGPWSSLSSAQYAVIEADTTPAERSEHSPRTVKISIGRCGGADAWYENPYSGIKRIYSSLISEQITFNEVVCRNKTQRDRPTEMYLTSSTLDICDEAYSAQARLVQHQAELININLPTKPRYNNETGSTLKRTWDGRGSFCVSGSRWVGSSADNFRVITSLLKS